VLVLIRGLYAAAAHQQAVGVDAVGGTGHQGDVILAFGDLQLIGLGGQHDGDFVHLVGEHPVQHGDGKGIAHLQLVEVGKQLSAGQAAVRRDDRVGRSAAHRQAGAFQMTCRHLQHAVVGAVVDGQLHADLFNGDVAHNARAGNIQRFVVAGKLIRTEEGVFVGGHLCVKGIGGVKVGAVIRIGHGVHVLRVACHRAGLVALVDVIADSGV